MTRRNPDWHRAAGTRLARRIAWGGLCVILAAVALGLAHTQVQARRQLEQDFGARADIARQFVASYVDDVFNRESTVGRAQLSGPTINDAHFAAVAQSFGFSAAVVLDSEGRALDIVPATPYSIGTDLADTYPHLASAEGGVATVSHVVSSVVAARPVVEFAVPFETPYGRRVLSGGYDVNTTPVANYLRNFVAIQGSEVYLVDVQTGGVVADTLGARPDAAPLFAQEPELAAAAARQVEGTFQEPNGAQHFVQRDVTGSPWRVIMSVPEASLYAPVAGATTWAPWAMFALVVVGTLGMARLLIGFSDSRAALASANADLVLLARVDKLTGLHNRRHLEEALTAALDTAQRGGQELAVLMLDVDHFKVINDTYGHSTGDRALQSLASALRFSLRPGDAFGRWGGEEFLVVLSATGVSGARLAAERLREAAMDTRVATGHAGGLRLTISVGMAVAVAGDTPDTLVARADAAVYRAKDAGRNTVAA